MCCKGCIFGLSVGQSVVGVTILGTRPVPGPEARGRGPSPGPRAQDRVRGLVMGHRCSKGLGPGKFRILVLGKWVGGVRNNWPTAGSGKMSWGSSGKMERPMLENWFRKSPTPGCRRGGRGGVLILLVLLFPQTSACDGGFLRLAMGGSYLASRELPLSVRVSAPSPAHLPRLA